MDSLKGFGDGDNMKDENLDEENVELNLGLSLNGRFGVDRRREAANNISGDNIRLVRSSSIADFTSFKSETEDTTSVMLNPPLTRTCSLPEVEWKKRKELQSLRRSEAKRKWVERIKSGRVVKRLPEIPRPSGFPVQGVGSPASGGSSGVSELESHPFSGTNKDTELKSTATHQSVSHQIPSSSIYRSNSIASHTSSQTINGNLLKDETLKMMFADMPCVSTKVNGVNGKKIEGFLYRYKKGEVRIVCVCHGSFLTPAEFVKHGGGGDVEHPLRHIVVIPPSL